MKLLSWNIQHSGGNRVARIIEAISAHDPDVIALSEFRTKPGVPLCGALVSVGWRFVQTTTPAGSDNGLCVLSRSPVQVGRPSPAPTENLVRWLDIDLPEWGFGFALLHIICSVPRLRDGVPGEAKTRFWNAVIGTAEAKLHEPYVPWGFQYRRAPAR